LGASTSIPLTLFLCLISLVEGSPVCRHTSLFLAYGFPKRSPSWNMVVGRSASVHLRIRFFKKWVIFPLEEKEMEGQDPSSLLRQRRSMDQHTSPCPFLLQALRRRSRTDADVPWRVSTTRVFHLFTNHQVAFSSRFTEGRTPQHRVRDALPPPDCDL